MNILILLLFCSLALHGQTLSVVGAPILGGTGTSSITYKLHADPSAVLTSSGVWITLDGQNISMYDHNNGDAVITTGGFGGTGYPILARTFYETLLGTTFSSGCLVNNCNSEPHVVILPSRTLGILNADGVTDPEDRVAVIDAVGGSSGTRGTILAISADITHVTDLSTWKTVMVTSCSLCTVNDQYNDNAPTIGWKSNIGVAITFVQSTSGHSIITAYKWSDVLFTSGAIGQVNAYLDTTEGPYFYACGQSNDSDSNDIACINATWGEQIDGSAVTYKTRHISLSGSTHTISAASTLTTGDTYYMANTSQIAQKNGSQAIRTRDGYHMFFVAQRAGKLYLSQPSMSVAQTSPPAGLSGVYWYIVSVPNIMVNAPTLLDQGSTFSSSTNLMYPNAVVDSNGTFYLVGASSDASTFISGVAFWRLNTDTAGTLRGPQTVKAGTQAMGCGSGTPMSGVGLYFGGQQYIGVAGHVIAAVHAQTSTANCGWTWYTMELAVSSPSSIPSSTMAGKLNVSGKTVIQ